MSQLFEKFSSKENLKRAYLYVQKELASSSLSVNPINHPATTAINDLGDRFFVALEKYLREGKYKPEKGFFVYMPKDNLGLRPVCVLSMIDRIVYQAIFNQNILGDKIDGQLSDKVCYANRVNDNEKKDDFLSQYFNGWDTFCKEQKKAFNKGYSWKLEVDVQQYYEHIPIKKLIEKISDDFGIKDEKILSILESQLCAWAEYQELPKGIPQGPEASAILGNAYLSSLDTFAEKELIGKDLRYLRYADDITLMGKSKEAVLKATEKIVRFLREHNLALNEKTKLTELEDDESIEAMRFFSIYDEDTSEIPADDFTIIQNKVPYTISAIKNGEKIEKSDFQELKYFLKVDTSYDTDLIIEFINIIPLRPSLTVPIIKYISECRGLLDWMNNSSNDAHLVDFVLWETYQKEELSEWSKFWILKLLVSNKDVLGGAIDEDIEKEVKRILSSKENSIFKIVCFYYLAIQGRKINIEQIKQAIEGSKSEIEKSLYSFFLLNAFQEARASFIKGCIEKLLNSPSHELNLIGLYLFRNKPKITIEDFYGVFSDYFLKKHKGKSKQLSAIKETPQAKQDFYLVRSENLIPVNSPSSILGMDRVHRKKHTVELKFPELVQWEKVILKLKEGLQDIEIWYGKELIKNTDYMGLGFFTGDRQKKKDRQWGFLCALSVLSATDITLATADKMRDMVAVNSKASLTKANVHQIKRTLSKRLRSLFKTSDDPFYDRRDYYHPKFTILPEPELRQEEIWSPRLKKNISQEPNFFVDEDSDNPYEEDNQEETF